MEKIYYFRNDLKNKKKTEVNVPHKENMMCLNESTLNPYKTIENTFLSILGNININRYYSSITSELSALLTEYIGNNMEPHNILWGNGADEMLYYLFTAVRDNNDSFAVSLSPSYFDYRSYSEAVGMNIKFVSFGKDLSFDLDEYEKLMEDSSCKLAILCNPNNPTGHLLDDSAIVKILNHRDKPVLIDETYYEFSGKTYVGLINEFPNLVIIRSFSKSFSAAGLRFGYLISCNENIREIEKVFTAFNSGILTQAFALAILKNKDLFYEHNKLVISERKLLEKELRKRTDIKILPTKTNFVTFTIGDKTKDLFDFLSDNEIALRAVWSHPILKNHLRITIGDANQNKMFLNKLDEFMVKKYEKSSD
ncbi:MAG: histidinol-phosphate transaminase [Candidatus Cloacimonetes bacterium]|nr:histidinol-phosphate transaminase [Candidatus Cloacimonadota bacterium]